MLVVDTNVVAYLLVEGDRTARVRDLWELDSDWRAPKLLGYELTNVFVQLVRQRALGHTAAREGLKTGLSLVRSLESEPHPARVLDIADKLGLSAYDASYLAAAEALRVPLVTEDTRLLSAAPAVTRSVDSAIAGY